MRRLAVVILVILALLGVVGVVVDRVVHSRAESAVLTAVSEEVALAPGAEVEIDGFPFLTQVLAGRLAEVRGSAPEAAFEGMALTDVRVAARGLSPQEPYSAENVELNADIPVRTLEALLAQEVPVLDGVVEIESESGVLRLSTSLAGLEVTIGLEPTAIDGFIGFRVDEVSAGGSAAVGQQVLSVVNEAVGAIRFEIPGLPEGMAPTRLAVIDEGLRLRLEGTDVVFPGD